jgi:hypothetical protein
MDGMSGRQVHKEDEKNGQQQQQREKGKEGKLFSVLFILSEYKNLYFILLVLLMAGR